MLIEQTIVETNTGAIVTNDRLMTLRKMEVVTIHLAKQGPKDEAEATACRLYGTSWPSRYETYVHFGTLHHRCFAGITSAPVNCSAVIDGTPHRGAIRHFEKRDMTLEQAVEDYQQRIQSYQEEASWTTTTV